jgi:hypothetical protein
LRTQPIEQDQQSDWNYQTFLLEGLEKLVQTTEWYDFVEDELTTALPENTVG